MVYIIVLAFDGCGCIRSLNKFHKLETEPVNEELDNYFTILTGLKQKAWYSHENYLRQQLKKSTISSKAFELLRTANASCDVSDRIVGTENYDILSNIDYQRDFGYFPMEDRTDE